MTLEIRTNHHWRHLVYRTDVPADVLADQFDWTNEDDHCGGFFQYRGTWYNLDEFMAVRGLTDSPLCDWDGYASDSYFSGIVVKLNRDGDAIQIGTYFS